MISGALPALLIFFILLFVPESEKWEAEHERGATSHWAKVDLFGVLIGSLAALVIIWAWSPVGVGALAAVAITRGRAGHCAVRLPLSGAEVSGPGGGRRLAAFRARFGHRENDALRRGPRRGGAARHLGLDAMGAALGDGTRARSGETREGVDALLALGRRDRRHDARGARGGAIRAAHHLRSALRRLDRRRAAALPDQHQLQCLTSFSPPSSPAP